MNWTTQPPKEDGWYWLRGGDSFAWFEVCVEVENGECAFDGEWRPVADVLPNAEWSDRKICEPKESK